MKPIGESEDLDTPVFKCQFMKIHFCLILSVLVLLSSCKTKNVSTNSRPKTLVFINKQNEYKFTALLIDAVKEKNIGNLKEAETILLDLYESNPNSDAVCYQLALVKQLQSKPMDAINYAQKALKILPENQWYLNLMGDLYDETSNFAQSNIIWKKLVSLYPQQLEYYYSLVLSYIYQGKWEDAVNAYDLLEKQTGPNEELALAKQRIWLRLNKVDKAINEIQKLIDLYPRESRYYLMAGDLCLNNKLFDKAKSYYDKAISIDPTNPYIAISMADYYKKTNQRMLSFDNLKMAFGNTQMDIDTKIKVLMSYYTVTEVYDTLLTDAYTLADILVKTHPDEPKAWSMYGDFLIRDKKYDEAKNAFIKVLEFDKNKFVIWEQLLMILTYQLDNESMLKYSSEAIEYFPSQPYLFLIKGMSLYNLGDYLSAIKSLEFGKNLIIENDETALNIWVYLGESYHKVNDHIKSDKAFDKALVISPKNTYILNNYSFYLSIRGENLEKAQKMAEMLNKLKPDNASYQDTYAWVLFKMKSFNEAKIWIEKAIQNGGDTNPVILEHYGDILWMLNDKDNSIKYWEKSKMIGNDSKILIQKIDQKKWVE